MLGDKDVCAVLAVKDLERAKKFYGETLGLKPGDSPDPNGIMYSSGNSKVLVYESQYAGTNQATAAAWKADDIEQLVESLKAKGVSFEQYDIPGVTREGDIHIMGELKAVWFKDPDGNILNITN